MTTCNATLTTATVTDAVTDAPRVDGTTVQWDHDAACWRVVEVHTLTCIQISGHRARAIYHEAEGGEEWTDNTKGATPHVEPVPEPVVTDAMVDAVRASGPRVVREMSDVGIRVMLGVALRAQQQEVGS